jgi:dipeptidyl-peptidase-4
MKILRYLVFSIASVALVASCATQKETVFVEREIIKIQAQAEDFPVDRYERAEQLMSWNLFGKVFNSNVVTNWVTDDILWYSVNTRNGNELMLVDISSETKEPLFDQEAVAANVSEMLELTDALQAYRLPFLNITVSDDASTVKFDHSGKHWQVNRSTGEVSITGLYEEIMRPTFSVMSPCGTMAAFTKDHNLFIRDMVTGEDTQLTVDGSLYHGYATDSQGWSRSDRPILYWSEDGKMISTYRLDERNVEKMHILRTASPRPELVSWPYAVPGDEVVPMHERLVIDVTSGSITWLKTEPTHQRTSNCCGLTRGSQWADNQFLANGSMLAFVATSRDYKEVTLKIADTRTGDVQTIFSERDEIFIETNLTSRGNPNWHVLYDSDEFIWFSRRDDWGHLYLYDLKTGELVNQITTGSWNVVDILRIDAENRKIFFTAVGMDPDRDPYQEYAFAINFDGTGLRSFTPSEGHHDVVFSPSANRLVSTRSDVQTPPVTVIKNAFGEVIMELERADITDLQATGWSAPIPFTAKARDGVTDIFGMIYKPSDFDPAKRYPIINNIYPGPQIGSVGTRAFSAARRGQVHAIAELGFIVVQIDALGTPMRSRAFHTAYYGDMSDNGLPDQITAMQQLAERHEWIDINRAAMYGHSGGGFATAAAMFNHSDFFKVGVSSAGNLDNRGYTYYWGEKFQGPLKRFEDGTDSFTNQALQLQVEGLSGHLLLSYGTMDTNVHPNMTHLVIDALIAANKDFDLMVMPNRGHGYANESYKLRRTMDYFVLHLLGKNPPKEYSFSR